MSPISKRWHTVFKADAKNRKASGIVDLHVWSDPDKKDHAVALFAVTDVLSGPAPSLSSEELAMHMERDGVTNDSPSRC